MDKAELTRQAKRVQGRLSYKGLTNVKLQQCREGILEVTDKIPTDEQIAIVVENLKRQLISQEPKEVPQTSSELAVTQEISQESNPDIWETLQPPEQPLEEKALTKTEASLPATITESQIKAAVEAKFEGQPAEIKSQIIEFATTSAYDSAQELEQALEKLRQVELAVMLQILSTHNNQRLETLNTFKDALDSAEKKRKEESKDFFSRFETRMTQLQERFGVKV